MLSLCVLFVNRQFRAGADTGTAERGYDMFVGNPPYYSDYRIAEVFIEQAYQSLKVDGVALFVTKQSVQVGDLIQ